jgi:hypothetical protein
MIRRMCLNTSSDLIYRTIAEKLEHEDVYWFWAQLMIGFGVCISHGAEFAHQPDHCARTGRDETTT